MAADLHVPEVLLMDALPATRPRSTPTLVRYPPRIAAAALASVLIGCTSETLTSSPAATSIDVPSPSPASTATRSTSPSAAPAQFVDVGDGRQLYLECVGEGSPTVILEAGMTGDHRTWNRVQPAIAGSTQVCTYDRANIPPSDDAPTPRTAADSVVDLRALLDAAGIVRPVILVGHSMGGLIAQLYAASHPEDVAGLVLVESNHPDEWDQFSAELTAEQIEADMAFSLDNSEGFDPYTSFEQAQAAGPLPDVPLIVVTAGRNDEWPPGWDTATFDALRAAQQADLAASVADGRQVFAEASGHQVPLEQPEVVIEAVEDVLGSVR